MTANEMKYRFNILYNKITKFDAPGYKDRELSELFTLSQNELVKAYTNPMGNKYGKGMENSEKRRKDLDNLIRNAYLTDADLSTSQDEVHYNGFMYTLPSDMLWAIQEECYMDRYKSTCTQYPITLSAREPHLPILTDVEWNELLIVKVKPVTHDEYNHNIENPFKKPYEELIWRLDYSATQTATPQVQHELINETGWTILRYRVRYYKIPSSIVVDTATPANQVNSELISTMHDEIIVRAVEMATGITAPEEYKIKAVEANKAE